MPTDTATAAPVLPARGWRRVIFGLFCVSGISGLLYEVAWTRMLHLLFGDTVLATSTVLTAFMAGLALGSWWSGRRIDRRLQVLGVYAALELGIGLSAVLLPLALEASTPLYVWLHRQFHTAFVLLSLVRFCLAFALLMVPTTLMGATLPVLSRYIVRTSATLGWSVGVLYALNTGGAVLGCFAAGYVLIGSLGLYQTVALGAGLNLGIALVVWIGRRWAGDGRAGEALTRSEGPQRLVKAPHPNPLPEGRALRPCADAVAPRAKTPSADTVAEEGKETTSQNQPDPAQGTPVYSAREVRLVLGGFALSGFTALAYEVIWTRALTFFIGNSTYAFSAMLTTFLCGLALGSLLLARVSDRPRHLLPLLGMLEVGIGVYGLLTIVILASLFYGLDTWWEGFSSAYWGTSVWLTFVKTFVVIFPPALAMGGTFPLVSKIVARGPQDIGRKLGDIYALNTLGGIAGAWVAGFVGLALLGMHTSLVVTALLNAGLGSVLLAYGTDRRRLRQGLVGAGVLGLCIAVTALTPRLRFADIAGEPEKEFLHYEEDSTGVVKVATDIYERKLLSINGWSVAGTGTPNPDVALVNDYPEVQKMLAHLPMLLHPAPHQGLVIGFGAGGTSWSMSRYNELEHLDIVEFVPGVIRAARFFPEVNHNVLTDPRLRVIIDDGRNYLLVTPQHYDVISVDTLDPKHAGNGNLYTEEFYRLSKRALKPGGIFVQWLPYHQVDNVNLKLIARTFQHVYPHATLWLNRFKGYSLLVGTLEPLRIDVALLEQRLRQPSVQGDLAEVYVATPWQFLESFTMRADTLRRYTAGEGAPLSWRPSADAVAGAARPLSWVSGGSGNGRPKRSAHAVAGKARLNSYNHPYVEFYGMTWHDPVDENLAELAWFADDVTPLLAFNGDYTPEQQLAIEQRVALQRRISRSIFRGYLANWRRQLQEGTREYRKALKLDPHDEGIKFALGIATRHKQQALAALERQPRDLKALSKLGYIAWNEQQYDVALQRFQQVLAIDPRQAAAYVHLGANYIAQERFAEATAAYLQAGRLNPEYIRLVEQSLDLIQHLQRAHERPDDPSVYLQLGTIYASDGRSDRAVEMFEKAVALAPSFVAGWLNLALNYEAEERDAEAMHAYSRVLLLEPDNPVAQNNYEKLALKTALARRAPTRLTLASEHVFDVDPDDASGYYQLGLRYLRNNEAEAAAAALEQALRLQPDHDAAPLFLGMAYTALRASSKAEAAYRRAIALAPQNAQAYNYLGLVYQQQQRYDKAVKAHQRAIDLDPDYAVAYANLAASYEALGKIKQALLAYDQALQRDASLKFVREKITTLRKQAGR